MPGTIGSDFYIEGTSTPSYNNIITSTKKEGKTSSQDRTFEREENAEVTKVYKHQTKLPALDTSRRTRHKIDNTALEVLLRIRRFHLNSACNTSAKTSTSSKSSYSFESSNEQDSTEYSRSGKWEQKGIVKYKNVPLPILPFPTVLKGQRLSVRGEESHEERRGQSKTKPATRIDKNRVRFEKETKLKTKTKGHTVPKDKDHERPVLYLPKVDKYDVTPHESFFTGKVCRVFKLNDLKTSLIYSRQRDSWVPARDKYLTNHSVFKAITQQPVVYLRYPSPVAGVKMTLKEQGAVSYAALIREVEKTNVPLPSDDEGFSPEPKKFVVKLPPLC